jgi:lipoprotein-anchoring transpeptidase ErfK/SrfK
MSNSPLQQKTVRPGSLVGYSYYYSKQDSRVHGKSKEKPKQHSRRFGKFVFLLIMLAIIGGGLWVGKKGATNFVDSLRKANQVVIKYNVPKEKTTKPPLPAPAVTPTAAAPSTNNCAGNTLNELVLVSISQRHLWACQYSTQVYDSPVVTGISYLAADLTPVGTYHVYAKETDRYLTGTDTTGSWDDFVHYWMPFLTNQYGAYGLHDATWRPANAFGNISPDSSNASHGCVELPLSTAKWLYGWVQIGTTVTIES